MDALNLSPERFKAVLESLSEPEQKVLIQIVQEFADTGESITYKSIWLEDYEEVPVDIDTFLESDEYIGGLTRHGEQIYPFWRNVLRELFAGGEMKAEEVAFSGAIGIGKTAIADYAISYLLYRLMCLRNPQKYFGFADTDEIAIFFFNATVELAMSVGYKRLHNICLESPWFMARGSRGGSDSNPYYIPPKHIVIKAGSKGAHGLGQQIYCLVGSTKVITNKGVRPIQELVGKTVNVLQCTPGGWKYEPAPVYLTGYTDVTIRVTLEDGSVIEGTPDHKVMLVDGTYKALGDLTEDDELYSEVM